MKGKTKLQTTDLHCSSLDTLPLSTSTLTLCPFHKTCSKAEQVLFTDEQIRSTNGELRPAVEQVSSTREQALLAAYKICLAVERVLSRTEQILPAGHPSWPAADRITLNPHVKE